MAVYLSAFICLLYLGLEWSHDLVLFLEVILDLLHSVLAAVELITR
jgi:hypothetical protein